MIDDDNPMDAWIDDMTLLVDRAQSAEDAHDLEGRLDGLAVHLSVTVAKAAARLDRIDPDGLMAFIEAMEGWQDRLERLSARALRAALELECEDAAAARYGTYDDQVRNTYLGGVL